MAPWLPINSRTKTVKAVVMISAGARNRSPSSRPIKPTATRPHSNPVLPQAVQRPPTSVLDQTRDWYICEALQAMDHCAARHPRTLKSRRTGRFGGGVENRAKKRRGRCRYCVAPEVVAIAWLVGREAPLEPPIEKSESLVWNSSRP